MNIHIQTRIININSEENCNGEFQSFSMCILKS